VILVARKVNLLHALRGDGIQVLERIELVIDRAHVDVVDVEQNQAIGARGDLAQKLPLCQAGIAEPDVARDVLQQDAAAEEILHGAHALDDIGERLLGIRKRQQVVRVAPGDAGPAEVVRDPGRLDALRERLELAQILAIERCAAADRQRYAVHRERIALADTHQIVQRPATGHQVILGQHLEPVDRGAGCEDRLIVRDAQSQSEAEGGKSQHGRTRGPGA